MNRREFITLFPMVGVSSYFLIHHLHNIDHDHAYAIIKSVQQHIIPNAALIDPSELFSFFDHTTKHPSFEHSNRLFLIEGAKKIHYQSGGEFIHASFHKQEEFLKRFTQTQYGYTWMSAMINSVLEGVLCDSIYCSNENIYKNLRLKRGQPRAQKLYLYG